MFGILYKLYHKNGAFHIFLISFIAFAILNILENIIHYNIGKMSNSNSNNSNNSNNNRLEITNPSKEDWKKIIITMLIFSLLQGALTLYLY
jgi:hypothetical protein